MNGYRGDLSFLFRDLNIPVKINSNSYWVVANKKDKKVELNTYNYKYNVVPNVIGMGLRDAIYLLEYQHLNVRVKGKGIVKTQSKTPGTFISKGDVITIELS